MLGWYVIIIKFITSGIDSSCKSYIEQKTSLTEGKSKDPMITRSLIRDWDVVVLKATQGLHWQQGCCGHVFESAVVRVA